MTSSYYAIVSDALEEIKRETNITIEYTNLDSFTVTNAGKKYLIDVNKIISKYDLARIGIKEAIKKELELD